MNSEAFNFCKTKYYLGIFFACLVLILLDFIMIKKAGFTVDEVYSYGLANHLFVDTIEMKPQSGHVYANGIEPFAEYMAVQNGERFNYKNVWKNQSEDVHPPFYYAILHTICSFIPGSISRWYAGVINIASLVLTLLIATRIVKIITNSDKASLIFACFFSTSSWILKTGTFFRMYDMAMFWCTFYTYLFVKYLDVKKDYKFYLSLFCSSVLGAITHYYVIVYLIIIAFVYGVILLIRKDYKQVVHFSFTMGTAAVVSIGIFPSMIKHLLVSDRGKQSIGNMSETFGDYIEKIQQYFYITFYSFFQDGLKWLAIILLFCTVIFWILEKKRKKIVFERSKIILLIVPSIIYFFFIVKIAVYVSERYMNLIYACILISIYLQIYYVVTSMLQNKNVSLIMVFLACVMINVVGVLTLMVPYFNSVSERDKKIEDYYTGADCLYIYDSNELWKIQDAYQEIASCKKTLFITDSEFEDFMNSELKNSDKLIVYIADNLDQDFLIASVKSVMPNLNKDVMLNEGYAVVHYLSID